LVRPRKSTLRHISPPTDERGPKDDGAVRRAGLRAEPLFEGREIDLALRGDASLYKDWQKAREQRANPTRRKNGIAECAYGFDDRLHRWLHSGLREASTELGTDVRIAARSCVRYRDPAIDPLCERKRRVRAHPGQHWRDLVRDDN